MTRWEYLSSHSRRKRAEQEPLTPPVVSRSPPSNGVIEALRLARVQRRSFPRRARSAFSLERPHYATLSCLWLLPAGSFERYLMLTVIHRFSNNLSPLSLGQIWCPPVARKSHPRISSRLQIHLRTCQESSGKNC